MLSRSYQQPFAASFKIFLAGVLCCLALEAQSAPKSDLWPRWQAHNPKSQASVSHGAWDGFLGKYVKPYADGINRVRYDSVTASDRASLKRYLTDLQAVTVSALTRAEQRAYWINLYNAATVDVVLDHYPVTSILKISISPGLFERGPWGKKWLRVEGESLSLNDIEHRILRPIWQDPRTHYAVNCASLGCPNLLTTAFSASQMEDQLNTAARAFVQHPRGARILEGRLIVSSIYVWFKADFGGDDAGVIAHLRRYSSPAQQSRLTGITKISSDQYDWSLNLAR